MNIKYLDSKDAIKFIWNTTKHELGHCLNYRINKRTGHDASFKAIVTAIGGDPSTYHDYEDSEIVSSSKRQPKTEVKCKCGAIFHLSPTRMKRAKLGVYTCSKCKENLKNLI
jgi:predicted SprT family Zn-dependent metalloprotease